MRECDNLQVAMQDRYDVGDQRSAFLSRIAAWVYINGKSILRDA